MPRIKLASDIEVGDVFWISFLDNHGKKVFKDQYIVINSIDDKVQIL